MLHELNKHVFAGFCALAVLAVSLVVPSPADALSVTPVHVEMTSTGSNGRAQVTVTNDSKDPIPVDIALQRMSLDENGERKFSKAADNFLVLPPQAMIAPGASQVFRVQWVGEPDLKESESYMLSVNQIPVKLPAGRNAVQVVMSFGVNINVAPPQGSPQLRLVSAGVATDKSGKRHPTITVENPSPTHALLPQSTIKLSAANGWSQTLSSTELNEKVGIGLVQPGKRRRFTLPLELPAGVQAVQASIDFKPR